MSSPISARQLLDELHDRRASTQSGELLQFAGVGKRDVYNITAPFDDAGRCVIAGRVEARDTEASEIHFFVESADGIWRPLPGAPVLPRLQDPCVTRIGEDLVLGGVEFPVPLPGGRIGWRMSFYRGPDVFGLQPFLSGPDHMKDIRLLELEDGRIAVCSRPQGTRGGRGTIGFAVADSLQQVTAEWIDAAPLLEGQFLADEWGGANELHRLPDGRLGVLGHIAWMQGEGASEEKHYYPMVFELDAESGQTTPLRIIACRADFPEAAPKRPGLQDVIFSGGLQRQPDGPARLYAGLSDAAAGYVPLPDPFVQHP